MKHGIAAMVMVLLATAPLQAGAAAPKTSSHASMTAKSATGAMSSQEAAIFKAIAAARKCNPTGVMKGYFDLGAYYSASGNLDRAKAAYEQGLAYAGQQQLMDQPMAGLLLCQLSTIYMRTQDFDNALALLGRGVTVLDKWPSMTEVTFKLRGVRDMLTSYNDGLHSMKQDNYSQAESDFKDAVEVGQELQEPNIVSISLSSMAWAQMKQDRYEAAESEIQKAMGYANAGNTVEPKLMALIMYGVLKSRQGDVDGARNYYRQALEGSDADFQKIKINRGLFEKEIDRLDMVQSELNKTSASAEAIDYYPDVMLTHKVFHWNRQPGVIKVYMAPGDSIPGWKDAYAERFKAACQRWQEALGDRVRFEFTDDPTEKVDTHVTWNDTYNKQSGQTEYRYVSNKLVLADINMNMKNYDGQLYDPETVYKLSLHEVGHLLGIAGHSRNPKDIMYPSLALATDLSSRDIATMRKLYQQAADITNPTGMTLAQYRETPEYQKLKAEEEPSSHF